jgi:hypothetical protein
MVLTFPLVPGKVYILKTAVYGRMQTAQRQDLGNMMLAQQLLVSGITTMTKLLIPQVSGILNKVTSP